MSDAHHGGIRAGGNITVGGDLNANATAHTTQVPATCAVTEELRGRVDDLLDALVDAGLVHGPPLGPVASDLRTEVEGATARPARIEQLLAAIEAHAVQITTIAAAVTATRLALTR